MDQESWGHEKPYCEVHDSFFNNAFFIHNDEFQGFLSKSMSLDLNMAETECPCISWNIDLSTMNCDGIYPVSVLDELEPISSLPEYFSSSLTDLMEDCSFDWPIYQDEAATPTTAAPGTLRTPSPADSGTESFRCSDAESFTECSSIHGGFEEVMPRRSGRVASQSDHLQTPSPEPQPVTPARKMPKVQQRPRKKLPNSAPERTRVPSDADSSHRNSKPAGAEAKENSLSPLPASLRQNRSARDTFLVEKRLQGLKYAAIKRLGGFEEAESTLRGRFRTLTKDKADRVRRPEWTRKDIKLLPRAVEKACSERQPKDMNVPWERVAALLHDSGSSYKFSSSACHRMWRSISDDEED